MLVRGAEASEPGALADRQAEGGRRRRQRPRAGGRADARSGMKARADLEDVRAEFPVLERLAYLNAGSIGPLAKRTAAAMAARLAAELEGGRGGVCRSSST